MKNLSILGIIMFVLTSFSSYLNEIRGLGDFYLGMEYEEAKVLLDHYKTTSRPLYEFGIDTEQNCIIVMKDNIELYALWFNESHRKKLKGIIVLDESIVIDESIHINMSLSDYLLKYPDSKIELDMINAEYEYITNSKGYSIEFMIKNEQTIGNYQDIDSGNPTSIFSNRDRKVDRILITKY